MSQIIDLPDNRSWIEKHGIKIPMIIIGMIFGYLVFNIIENIGSNKIGLGFSNLGIVFIIIAFETIAVSQHKKFKFEMLWDLQTIHGQKVSYPFKLHENGVIVVRIHKIIQDCVFRIREFDSSIEDRYETRILYEKSISKGERHATPSLNFKKGVYHLSFQDGNEAEFAIGYAFFEKPYELFFSVGLMLMEISIPILITGIFLLIFNVAP